MKMNGFLASLGAAALLCGGVASSEAATHKPRQRAYHLTSSVTWHEGYGHQYASARPGHLTDLVGDTYSGLGFYPLPHQYRAAAERYGRYRVATNAVRYAVASQAIETPYFFPAGGNDYKYGVFNPNDGVGTPFFAGYYAN